MDRSVKQILNDSHTPEYRYVVVIRGLVVGEGKDEEEAWVETMHGMENPQALFLQQSLAAAIREVAVCIRYDTRKAAIQFQEGKARLTSKKEK